MREHKYILFMLALLVSVSMRGQYNPTNPGEPGVYYTLTLQADPAGGGSFNIGTTTSYSEGTTIALRAYNSSNFVFVSWEQDGEVISTASSFSYKMPAQNVTLVAHYKYNPSNPAQSEGTTSVYHIRSPTDCLHHHDSGVSLSAQKMQVLVNHTVQIHRMILDHKVPPILLFLLFLCTVLM